MIDLPDHPFLYSALSDVGMTRRQLRNAVAEAVVRRVLVGVYCRSDLPDTPELRARAARLVVPKHVVVSDHSASWLHGIDSFDPASLDVPPALEVVSIGGNDRTRHAGVLGGKRQLVASDICLVGGVSVTTPLRTACDLACLRGRRAALAVLDAYMRAYGLKLSDFEKLARRFAGRRGVRQLRELIQLASPERESQGESWVFMDIIDAGLPVPRPQVWVELSGFGRVRLDFAYPTLKIAVEYDGEEFHSSDEDKEADAKRREALRRAGWIVIVVTKHDFTAAALDTWLGELRAAIAERSPSARRTHPRKRRV